MNQTEFLAEVDRLIANNHGFIDETDLRVSLLKSGVINIAMDPAAAASIVVSRIKAGEQGEAD